MLIRIGRDPNTGNAVVVDTQKVINPHMQVTGISGMGKTHTLQEMVTSFVESAADLRRAVRVHVFDPHEDIELPYSSVVRFSEAAPFGYNPLEINPDVHYGGVRRAIQRFMLGAKKLSSNLGTKQEAVMRYVLEDIYASRGFKADNPSTWVPEDPRYIREIMKGRENRIYLDVGFEHRERFKAILKEGHIQGGFDDFGDDPAMRSRRSWWVHKDQYAGDLLMWEPKTLFKTAPNLDDVVRFTERKLKALLCGTNNAAISLLNDVNKAARAYHRRVDELTKRNAALDDPEKAQLMEQLNKAKEKAGDAYNSYLDAIVTGRELEDRIRYNSVDVLTSVYERFQNLRAIGIYSPEPPPFDPAKPIWQYQIKPLENNVQAMFVELVCTRVFERSVQRGLQDDVVELLVLDEGRRFVGQSEDDVINKIANEARKFGLGLWVLSQTPTHFPDDFLKATGTILILGLANGDVNVAARKLGCEEAQLRSIVPQQTALVQIKAKRTLVNNFSVIAVD